MDEARLNMIWDEMMKEAFRSFIDEYIGWEDTDQDLPACFGSGDEKLWCANCGVREGC